MFVFVTIHTVLAVVYLCQWFCWENITLTCNLIRILQTQLQLRTKHIGSKFDMLIDKRRLPRRTIIQNRNVSRFKWRETSTNLIFKQTFFLSLNKCGWINNVMLYEKNLVKTGGMLGKFMRRCHQIFQTTSCLHSCYPILNIASVVRKMLRQRGLNIKISHFDC